MKYCRHESPSMLSRVPKYVVTNKMCMYVFLSNWREVKSENKQSRYEP